MKKLRSCAAALLAVAVVTCLSISVAGQTASDGNLASVAGGGSSARWEITATNAGGTLTISFPDGRSFRKTFRAGDSPQVTIGDKYFDNLPDGVYSYELRLASAPSDAAKKARGKDDDPENERAGRKRAPVPASTQSGSFAVVNGSIVVAGGSEPEQKRDAKASTRPAPRTTASANVLQRIRNNHRAFFMPDDVIPDDLIVQGSACVGLDCVNGEVFGFDTIRMKENNTRLQFDDTSTSAGFATNNWQIRANDQASGGSSFLGFVDQGATGNSETGTIIGRFDAGAPANSFRVSSNGKVGLRTATPVLDIHMNTSDTPAVRFEQNNSGGFTAQTWDIGANEANFFVRDVTGGSRLSFRIRPGAPTSSIDISADGDVGIGTAGPNARLDLKQASDDFLGGLHLRRASTNDTWAIVTGGDNNLYMGYATDASLANAVADFTIFPLVVTTNNRVGVRTAAPDQALSVNGDASKTGGGSWQVFSDERLKNIKGKFTPGLSAVMRLQPVRYQYKPDNALALKSEGDHVGFRAQELREIIPDAVSTSESGYLMVNNDPILWTMLNAIKEQQQQIAGLKAEVRKLQTAARRRRR
ncbi:MAG TPA: tail fiber domain-containing protein [Pyrinomonadaceae bacterium]